MMNRSFERPQPSSTPTTKTLRRSQDHQRPNVLGGHHHQAETINEPPLMEHHPIPQREDIDNDGAVDELVKSILRTSPPRPPRSPPSRSRRPSRLPCFVQVSNKFAADEAIRPLNQQHNDGAQQHQQQQQQQRSSSSLFPPDECPSYHASLWFEMTPDLASQPDEHHHHHEQQEQESTVEFVPPPFVETCTIRKCRAAAAAAAADHDDDKDDNDLRSVLSDLSLESDFVDLYEVVLPEQHEDKEEDTDDDGDRCHSDDGGEDQNGADAAGDDQFPTVHYPSLNLPSLLLLESRDDFVSFTTGPCLLFRAESLLDDGDCDDVNEDGFLRRPPGMFRVSGGNPLLLTSRRDAPESVFHADRQEDEEGRVAVLVPPSPGHDEAHGADDDVDDERYVSFHQMLGRIMSTESLDIASTLLGVAEALPDARSATMASGAPRCSEQRQHHDDDDMPRSIETSSSSSSQSLSTKDQVGGGEDLSMRAFLEDDADEEDENGLRLRLAALELIDGLDDDA